VNRLIETHFKVSVEDVSYEFQKGENRMLKVSATQEIEADELD